MDPESRSVQLRFEQSPDPAYEDAEVDVVSVLASTQCASAEEFFGFCHALTAAMRQTPFHLQDPSQIPFAAMPREALVLSGIPDGLPPTRLRCRIPREIAVELWKTDRVPESFALLVGPLDR